MSFDFFSERWLLNLVKKGYPFTNQTFGFCGTRVQIWENDHIDIFQKKKSKMIAMVFILVNN